MKVPQVGGVVLFSRNYRDPEQLHALCDEIHGLRDPRLVLVILRGGMDGLNAVVPYGDANYRSARGSIALSEPGRELGVLPLDTGFEERLIQKMGPPTVTIEGQAANPRCHVRRRA